MENIKKISDEFRSAISKIDSLQDLEQIRINFLGKKSEINSLFGQLKNLSIDDKKQAGLQINELRDLISSEIEKLKKEISLKELNQRLANEKIDITEPARSNFEGSIHPISKVIKEVKTILSGLGFEFAEGPEVEDDFHNFSALNIPKDHPARQMQDTFYLKNNDLLLRTHTSNTQIRKMLNSQPPMQIASLGRVFRCDSDKTHTPMFHQVEGFAVDKDINMGNLKWVLEVFLQKFFDNKDLQLRFRPSFFPFTEPSAEVDVNYSIDNEKRIKIGKGDKFMEILGCGMIHPNVLKNCNIDSEKFQGFAFGIGIERLAMLKYGINDLRMLFENDIRFLNHYSFKHYQML